MFQANGGVERAVGIAKKILSDLALLSYRVTTQMLLWQKTRCPSAAGVKARGTCTHENKGNEPWGNRGRVSLAEPNHRRYQVETPTGTVVRNWIHLQLAPPDPPHQDASLPMPPTPPVCQQPSPEPSPQSTPTRMLHPPSTERTSRVSGRVIKRPKTFSTIWLDIVKLLQVNLLTG